MIGSYPKCDHCDHPWHGMPCTKAVWAKGSSHNCTCKDSRIDPNPKGTQ